MPSAVATATVLSTAPTGSATAADLRGVPAAEGDMRVVLDSPLGELLATSDGGAVTGLHFLDEEPVAAEGLLDPGGELPEPLGSLRRQLAEFFAGHRRGFELPLAPEGTEFQRRVWAALVRIPYGETRTYGELAASIGRPGAQRAVGGANGRNPIVVVVPCHRVVAAGGRLGGFSCGLWRKDHLLALEGGHLPAEGSGGVAERMAEFTG